MNLGDNRVGHVSAKTILSCDRIDSNQFEGRPQLQSSIGLNRSMDTACSKEFLLYAGLDIFVNVTIPHFHCCTPCVK